MPPYAIHALAEAGKALLISQNLEKLLLEMFEFRKLHQSFEYAKQTGGAITPEKYKLALTNGVKKLRDQDAIHPTVDSALTEYIENRHILVHRWALQYGFPDQANVGAWETLRIHSLSVTKQAIDLFTFFSKYLGDFAMPEMAARDYASYQARMLSMFNREFKAS